MNINSIFLRRKSKICLPEITEGNKAIPVTYLAAMLRNFAGLGFIFTTNVIERLKYLPVSVLEDFYLKTMITLKQLKGVKTYEPMYPNFPKQVMEASSAELFMNAIVQYWFGAYPAYEKEERLPLFEETEITVIDLGTPKEFGKIFHDMMSSNASISELDKKELDWFFANLTDLACRMVPAAMPQKEILAYTVGLISKYVTGNIELIMPLFTTATDVLRLAVALSDGDVSLAKKTKFRNFTRPERRLFLAVINSLNYYNLRENMQQYREPWLRIAHQLHPGEVQFKYPTAFKAFHALRNENKVRTFDGKVEIAFKNKNCVDLCTLLVKRPGVFARTLDRILRSFPNEHAQILSEFATVAAEASTPVLIQTLAHIRKRSNTPQLRSYVPKGNIGKVQIHDNTFTDLPSDTVKSAEAVCEKSLETKFSDLDEMQTVFLDDNMVDYVIPFGQRSASEALRIIPRGSHMPLADKSTLRLFTWWKNNTGRVDVDLSVLLFREDWSTYGRLSYTNLRDDNIRSYHSGDITSPAPAGACEFVDINKQSALRKGARFVLMNLLSYTRQPFKDFECIAGWMDRDGIQSGEIFEPTTVTQRYDVNSDVRVHIPVLFDLKENKAIWIDLAITDKINRGGNNVESNAVTLNRLAQVITERGYYNLHELFKLHTRARKGKFVETPEEADVVFTASDYKSENKQTVVTPYDTEVIAAEFLQ
jgi:hypothetical protein